MAIEISGFYHILNYTTWLNFANLIGDKLFASKYQRLQKYSCNTLKFIFSLTTHPKTFLSFEKKLVSLVMINGSNSFGNKDGTEENTLDNHKASFLFLHHLILRLSQHQQHKTMEMFKLLWWWYIEISEKDSYEPLMDSFITCHVPPRKRFLFYLFLSCFCCHTKKWMEFVGIGSK